VGSWSSRLEEQVELHTHGGMNEACVPDVLIAHAAEQEPGAGDPTPDAIERMC
jgi:hypothetical protein